MPPTHARASLFAADLDALRATTTSFAAHGTDTQCFVASRSAIFLWDPASTETDDGSASSLVARPTAIDPGDPGRWVAFREWLSTEGTGQFRPEWFGAVGDGVADDTAALQAAIDAAYAIRGTVLLGKRQYRFTSALNTRTGKFNVVGQGWSTNVDSLYSENTPTNYYAQYRADESVFDPHFNVSGSVLYADGCDGFIRDDLGAGEQHSFMVYDSFALVGSGTSDKIAFNNALVDATGAPTTVGASNATLSNIHRNLGVFMWYVGIDVSLQYASKYFYCTIRGCKTAIRAGVPSVPGAGVNASGGNSAAFFGLDLDSNDECIALYEATQLTFDGIIAQNFVDFFVVRPNGNNCVTQIALRGPCYLESSRNPNRVLVFSDDQHGVLTLPITASQIWIEGLHCNGANRTFLTLEDGGGWALWTGVTLRNCDDYTHSVTLNGSAAKWTILDCKFLTLSTSAGESVAVINTAVSSGGAAAVQDHYINRLPALVGTLDVLQPDTNVTTPEIRLDPASGMQITDSFAVTATAVTNEVSDVKTGRIGPLVLAAGRTDNYSPTDLAKSARLYLTADVAGSQLSGLAAQADGFELTVFADANGVLTFNHLDVNSVASARFFCVGGANRVCATPDVVKLYYEGGSVNHWWVA